MKGLMVVAVILCCFLYKIVQKANKYTNVFKIVGESDVLYRFMQCIFKSFKQFRAASWPTEVPFAGHMKRKLLPQKPVAKNSLFYWNKLR